MSENVLAHCGAVIGVCSRQFAEHERPLVSLLNSMKALIHFCEGAKKGGRLIIGVSIRCSIASAVDVMRRPEPFIASCNLNFWQTD